MKRTVTITDPALADPHKARRERQRTGLGTRLQRAIHGVINVMPISDEAKQRIKNCPGCGDRVKFLDKHTT